jgi:hypothetical protein
MKCAAIASSSSQSYYTLRIHSKLAPWTRASQGGLNQHEATISCSPVLTTPSDICKIQRSLKIDSLSRTPCSPTLWLHSSRGR